MSPVGHCPGLLGHDGDGRTYQGKVMLLFISGVMQHNHYFLRHQTHLRGNLQEC